MSDAAFGKHFLRQCSLSRPRTDGSAWSEIAANALDSERAQVASVIARRGVYSKSQV